MRRALVPLVIGLQLGVYLVALGWAAKMWQREPWAGFAWQSFGQAAEMAGPLMSWLEGQTQPGMIMIVPDGGPAAEAGLQVGDRLTRIAGAPADDLGAVRQATADLAPGDRVEVEVSRDGALVRTAVGLTATLEPTFTRIAALTSVALACAFLGVAALVAWARPDSAPARVFLFLASSAAGVFVVWAMTEPILPDLRGLGPYGSDPWMFGAAGLVSFFTFLMVNLLLHFALVFPSRRPVLDRWPEALVWIHGLPFLPLAMSAAAVGAVVVSATTAGLAGVVVGAVAIVVVAWVRIIRTLRIRGWRHALGSHPWWVFAAAVGVAAGLAPALQGVTETGAIMVGILWAVSLALHFLVVIVVWSVLTCVALARSYREAGPEERRQIRWPLWGLSAPIVLSMVLLAAGVAVGMKGGPVGVDAWRFHVVTNLLSKLSYTAIPVSFAFGILRYRVMQIDVVIRRTLVYGGLTAFVVGGSFALAAVLGVTVVRWLDLTGQTATVLATLAVVAATVPLRRRLQHLVDRWMYRRRLARDELLARADARLRARCSLDDFCRALADDLHEALQCSPVGVWLGPDASRSIRLAASVGGGASATGRAVAFDPVWATDATVELTESSTVGPLATRLCAPSRLGDRTVGLISSGPRPPGELVDSDDHAVVAAAAEKLALAVAASGAAPDDTEAQEARKIQRSLLPRRLPEVAGLTADARWVPAREVSGDGYDALELDGDRLLVMIADVAGKGIPAALLMSNLLAALRSSVDRDGPAAIADRTRSVVIPGLDGGRFVTTCVVELDPVRRSMRWANLGHEPPLLVRSSGQTLELDATGPAVARLLAPMPVVQREVPLQAGDRLVMFTDGVTEALDPDGVPFGRDRLATAVQAAPHHPAAVAEVVVAAVRHHTGGAFQDDVTLVAISMDEV